MADSARLAGRLQGLPPTIFATMSALAASTGAINLGQGFPDEDGPTALLDAAVEALRTGQNQYAPGIGIPALREAIAAHQARNYGISLDPDTQVVVTAGATEAIAAAILALVDPGDEVVVFEPYYDSYVATIGMAGGVRRPVTLRAPDFRPDLDQLRSVVSDSTKVILLNTPHNPTGTVFTGDELGVIAELAIRHDAVVVSDEVYEHLVFNDAVHVPIATLPGMADRTVTIGSAGKSFSVTGWKVGWATGSPDLVSTVLAAKQWLTYTNAAPLQPAVAYALAHESAYVESLRVDLQRKRDLWCAGLLDLGWDVSAPQGTYFALSDVSSLGYDDAMAMCLDLPARAGVVGIPAQVFYDDPNAGRHLVRWAFCKQTAVLESALERLRGLAAN